MVSARRHASPAELNSTSLGTLVGEPGHVHLDVHGLGDATHVGYKPQRPPT